MKKFIFRINIFLIFFFAIQSNLKTQWWDMDLYENIHNTNGGSVLINTTLKWANGNSYLSNDQGGSIELGYPQNNICSPYIDFHIGGIFAENFNTRIINSGNYLLDFIAGSSKLSFNGNRNGPYDIPSLRLSNSQYIGNSLQFESSSGLSAIDFWHDGTAGIINFFADYNNPNYNQFSVKYDNLWGNTCGWGNDQSWLAAGQEGTTRGPSIHLNQMGNHPGLNWEPYISFAYGYSSLYDHNSVVLKNTGWNQLDIFTNTNRQGEGGNKIMSIKNDGVYAKKITVQSSWSDFVFKSDYNLKPLAEVEKYIKENGHLEGIPDEHEVTQNGIDLGDMSSKLLQKIEELSLYVIDLNKQVESLKKENEDMKSLINNK